MYAKKSTTVTVTICVESNFGRLTSSTRCHSTQVTIEQADSGKKCKNSKKSEQAAAIVLGVLLNHISTLTALSCCSGMLGLAFVLQRSLIRRMAVASKAGGDALGAQSSDDEDEGSGKSALMAGSVKDF